jgi:hypothetical protein
MLQKRLLVSLLFIAEALFAQQGATSRGTIAQPSPASLMDAQPQNRPESVKPKPESSPPVVGVVPGLQTTDQHLADIIKFASEHC